MLKADIGMNALHFGVLSLGVALNLIHYFRRALFCERLGHTFNIAAAIVWACCWIFFPNALVRVLFSQGPYSYKEKRVYGGTLVLGFNGFQIFNKSQPLNG